MKKEETKIVDITEFRDVLAIEGLPSQGQLTVVIRKIAWGETMHILDTALETISIGGKIAQVTHPGIAKINYMLKAITSAPFPVTKEYIETELDPGLGNYLSSEIEKFNHVGAEKKSNSQEAGEEQAET